MIIIGAKGLAKELLTVLHWDGKANNIFLFDNVNKDVPDIMYDRFKVIKTWENLKEHFYLESPEFALGVGSHKARSLCAGKAASLGGKLCSIVSSRSLIGTYGVEIKDGVCILSHATITADVLIGRGSLVNKAAIISHDVSIGEFCIISPGAKVLGNAKVGDRTEVGANAVILPGIEVGCNCQIGAGAVVTKNIPDGYTVAGIPAKPLERKNPK
jgi:sugar O-acyltransferase (sialic acid O-acetyltransferase NeuD family)